MSSIPPSMNIASSLAQTVAQQGDVAKAAERKRSEEARFAQKMREQLRKHLETVEDSYEATDELIHVQDEPNDRGAEQGSEKPEEPDHPEPSPPRLEPPSSIDRLSGLGLDIEA